MSNMAGGLFRELSGLPATTNWILADAPVHRNGAVGLKEANRSGAECAGVIALIESEEQARRFESLSLPCVSISSALNEPDLLTVACDDKMIGSLAASHFLERQMRHFGFVGLPDRNDSKVRFNGFSDRLSVDGFTKISKHEVPEEIDSAAFGALGQWIESLPKPAGIFAMSDVLGRMVVDACRSASVRVPAAVSVLGCGNDPVICGLSSPALSSVALPAERVGFEAADLLATLISGKRPAERHRLIQVSSVIPRESTDNVSVRDPDVANALRFILAHAGEWIGVRELLLALPVQRRSLERQVQESSGAQSAGRNPPGAGGPGQAASFQHGFADADRRPAVGVFRGEAVVAGLPGPGGDDANVVSLAVPAAGRDAEGSGGSAGGAE